MIETSQLTAILPFRSFWTTVNAGLPNRPVGEPESGHRSGRLTKDLD